MQFRLLSVLLASLLVFPSSLSVLAAPVKRDEGIITLPLKRYQNVRDDLHPLVRYQLQANRAEKRLARMTRRQLPSDEFLAENLRNRLVEVYGSADVAKRFVRPSLDDVLNGKEKEIQKSKTNIDAAAPSNNTGSGTDIGGTDAKNALSDGSLTLANSPTASDSLGLTIESHDVGYVATVQIGTPAKDFLIIMDSGSADFWVGSETCTSTDGGNCGEHQFLGKQSSSTFADTAAPFNVTYGTGSVAGTIVTDDVNIAGIPLKKHTFGVATVETPDFSASNVPSDGLMGLAKSTLSEQQTLTPIESMKQQGLVKAAITSYKLGRVDDKNNDGEVSFGGLDAKKFDAQTLQILPNVNQGFWEAGMNAVSVNGKDLGFQGRSAILDTGTTLIFAPVQDAVAIHQAIPGSKSLGGGMFSIPCNSNATVAFTFGKLSFAIDPRDMAIEPINTNSPDCLSGIGGAQLFASGNQWLVGDVFLKNAYFSTNVDKDTIALAKLA